MRVVLFVIDGTILTLKGQGRRALARALDEVFGATGPYETWDFGDKTDPLLCRELMNEVGLDTQTIEAGIPEVLRRYVSYLGEMLAQGAQGVLMPGIPELLETLSADERFTLGVLTGNVREGADLKLGLFDLGRYFDF